jgi:hypothetical protein
MNWGVHPNKAPQRTPSSRVGIFATHFTGGAADHRRLNLLFK